MSQNILHNRTLRETLIPAVLNSYSIVLFLNNKLLAIVIMLTTFIDYQAGLSGLLAVLLAVSVANLLGFDKLQLRNGVLSFNALLVGIGIGTFFEPGIVFFMLLLLAALMTLLLSVSMGGWLFKYGLPFLSIPFVVTFWLMMLPSSSYEQLGLVYRSSFLMGDVTQDGSSSLMLLSQSIDSMQINQWIDVYLRSLSSIFFQNNLLTGALIAIALLISSRILFSLSVIGFLSASLMAQLSGIEVASITYYNIGANYMMVAFAIGGFFIIPSRHSYLWAVLLVPLTSLVLLFFTRLLGFVQLPVFSLPFSLVTILFVHFLKQRATEKKLILTPYQHYSPESNLYTYTNNKNRYARFQFFPLHLPFWGEWTVTQGHNGKYTHQGEWGKALDFMILDGDGKSYKKKGLLCADYYCYGKPVVAPADGVIEEITDQVDDNEIGLVNTVNNWGNSIIIRHMPGVYTQLSHLRKGSFQVSKGAFVRRGDVLASCGNSGRSPEPHLHFQVQASPFLGSKTLDYPIAYYNNLQGGIKALQQYTVPQQGDLVSDINPQRMLYQAFNFMPNAVMNVTCNRQNGKTENEQWEAFTDANNYTYFYSRETDSMAYYVCDQGMFYFTAFYGSKKSLLYYFYLSAYNVYFGDSDEEVTDDLPLNMLKNNRIQRLVHDFIAPFNRFIHIRYSIRKESPDNAIEVSEVKLKSSIHRMTGKKTVKLSESSITISQSGIMEFTYNDFNEQIKAVCTN